MIQEFHLSITPVGPDCYWLRTEAVAAGVPLAEAQVTWPVESWLQQAEALFQDPLQALLSQPLSGDNAAEFGGDQQGQDPAWIQLGKSLYQHLFQDRIRDSWLAAQGIAQNRGQTLRLRLGFKDSRLQRLPWELLYGDDRPLATGVDVSLCRYYQALGAADSTASPSTLDQDESVNVLVVISAPDDQERLSLRQEVQSLIQDLQLRQGNRPGKATANGHSTQPIELNLTILEQPGRPELAHALEQGQFQVLHYAGHSDVSDTGGALYLVNKQTGLTDWLSGEDLAGLLVNNGIRLAVFNSCRGAYTATDDAEADWREQNLVQALVNRGVPGVIAMAERIPDDVAVTFTRLLYRNLQCGYSVDLCLSRVRQGLISAYRSDQPFWMLPILYLRPNFDGYLYDHPIEKIPEPNETQLTLSDGPLVPPDYSTDPDISHLAEEIFSGHVTVPLPNVEAEQSPEELSSAASSQWSSAMRQQDEPSPTELPNLLGVLEQQSNPQYLAETASVNELVDKLSHSPEQDFVASRPAPPLADQAENLLPDWPHPSVDLKDQLPEDPDYPNQSSNHPKRCSLSSPFPLNTDGRERRSWLRPSSFPENLTVWIGLGIFGLLAASVLAITALWRLGNNAPPVTGPDPFSNPGSLSPEEATPPNTLGRDSATMTAALGALAEDKPEIAAEFINQLLDQGDLEAAFGVINAVRPKQLLNPEISFVRGRLVWQQGVTGRGLGTANDAQRYWTTAVETHPEFLEAWVALGFAHYTLGDFNEALRAWKRAIELDRQALQDIDPAGQLRFTSEYTTYAYAGLAMVNQKLSELNPVEEQQKQYQQQAAVYFNQVIGIEPLLLDPESLALQWLWSPELIKSWQETINRIAIAEGGSTTDELE